MLTDKKKLLLLADWYDPAFKAGGPVRSCVNFAENMKDDLDIYILTSDRDLGDDEPLRDVRTNQWMYNENLHIYYASTSFLSPANIQKHIADISPDYIFLNSMFSRHFTVYPLWLKFKEKIRARIVLSPRGMLKASALRFKFIKKKIFLSFLKATGLYRQIIFLANDSSEQEDVRRIFGKQVKTSVASNFPAIVPSQNRPAPKKAGEIKIIFMGRMHPIKNLLFLLKVLKDISGRAQLTIVGSKEDRSYWRECEQIINSLPGNIKVSDAGEVRHHELVGYFAEQHIFALPTQGENFGHAIFDALAAGKPVLISDQTPWRNLAYQKAGWDFSLVEPRSFGRAIEDVIAMEQEQYNEWSTGAWQLAKNYTADLDLRTAYKNIFQ